MRYDSADFSALCLFGVCTSVLRISALFCSMPLPSIQFPALQCFFLAQRRNPLLAIFKSIITGGFSVLLQFEAFNI